MITPQNLTATMRRNDNPWRTRFTARIDNGAPYDFTGHEVTFQMREYPGGTGEPLIEALSSATAGTRLNCSNAGIEVVIMRSDIRSLPNDAPAGEGMKFVYDVMVKQPNGDENIWFEGLAVVNPGVTVSDGPNNDPGAVEPPPNLLQNGGFGSTDIWTRDPSYTAIGSGVLTINDYDDDGGFVSQTVDLTEFVAYATSLKVVSRAAGQLRLVVGGTAGTWRTAPGTYTEEIVAGSTDQVRIQYSPGSSLAVDDVVVSVAVAPIVLT